MTNLTTSTQTDSNALLQGGTVPSSTTLAYAPVPVFMGMSSGGNAAHATLVLSFSTEMKAGSGPIFVTDGAVQSVIDSATGLTSLRVVGASDTHQVSAGSLRYEGEHVYLDAYGLKPGVTYSVIIAPGALVSTGGKAFAGLRTPGQAAFSAGSGDTTGPTLATVHFDGATVKAGQDIKVTLTFSEKVGMPDPAAFSTPHAQLTDFSSADGITWHASLRATEPGIAIGANNMAIDMTKVRDLAGNAGSGTMPGPDYAVDTVVTSWVTQVVGLYDDAGPHADDLVTHGRYQLIEGAISGRIGTGQHFELRLNGTLIDAADITLEEVSEGSMTGTWWSYLADLPEGTSTLTARIVDDAGHNSGEVSRQIVIDNTAPVFTSSANGATAFSLDSPITIALSEDVYWEPSEGRGDSFEIEDKEGNLSYVPFSAAARSEDGRTLTLPAAALNLTAGNDYIIRLPTTLTDLAGNDFGAQAIRLHTAGTYVDVMPPRAISAKVINHAGTYGVGAELEIRVKFNEAVTLVSGTPQLLLNNGGKATYVSINAANEMVFKYVVAAGQDTAELDIIDYASLLGSVADLAGHRLDDDHVEFYVLANDTAENFGSDIVIVTTGPTPLAVPQLASTSDSGAAGDHITADNTPTFTGSGALPGAAVYLYDGDTVVASGTADAGGNWSLTPTAALADGAHNVNVRHADSHGTRSGPSPSYPLQIDSTVSVLAAPALDASSDTGVAGDGVTSDNTPTLSGSGAEPGAVIGLYEGSTKLGTAVADASGHWTTITAPLADGTRVITASQVDTAGNRSAESAALTIKVDTAAASLAAPVLDAGSDSGVAGDRITNDNTPTLRGSGAEANARIDLYEGTAVVASTTADASGNWSVTTATLADGSHTFSVKQIDTAGNHSPVSAGTTVTIAATATVGAPGAPALAAASDSGTAGDLVTNKNAPVFTGSGAAAGATVELYSGATKLGQASADGAGNWSITSTVLADGIYTLATRQLDTAGNRSAASTGVVVKIDSAAPTALGAPVLDGPSDTGVAGDNFTKINTPTMTGSGAEAGAKIVLYAGTTAVGTATASTGGTWAVTTSTLPDGISSLTAVQVDAAGNQSAPSPATALKVRTTGGPAVTALTLDAASDSGASGDLITNDSTPTVKGGGAEAGATVELYAGATLVGSALADGSGNWSVTAVALGDGNHAFTAKQVDAADNRSPVSSALAVRIDTTASAAPGAPLLDAASNSGSSGDMVTNHNMPVIRGGGAEAGATIKLYSGGVALATTTADSGGNWTVTISTPIADGSYALTATQLDEAGNASAHSSVATLVVDTTTNAPTIGLDPASDTGTAGDRITKLTTPTIKGSAEAGATVVLYDGTTLLGSTTANASGDWSLATPALGDGSHTLHARQTDLAGNASGASATLELTVDATPPATLAAPDLASASDSGTKGDRVTNDATPTVTGGGATPGAAINLYNSDGSFRGSTTADGSGNWSFDITAVYADGGYGLIARELDVAGNLSAASDTVTFYFDTVTPIAPNITLAFASDTGLSGSDYITNDGTPTFNGTSEAYATIRLYESGTEVATTTASASGNWSITLEVATGTLSFTATQTDKAGNTGAAGGPIPLTVDLAPPSAPGAPALDASTDSGIVGDGHTTTTAPKFTGSGVEAFAKVELYADTTKVGEATADGSGNWSVTSSTLVPGTYSMTAHQTDTAGNVSASSSAVTLVIDSPFSFFSSQQAMAWMGDTGSDSPYGADTGEFALAGLVGVDAPESPPAYF